MMKLWFTNQKFFVSQPHLSILERQDPGGFSTSLCQLCRIRLVGPQVLNFMKDLRGQHLICRRPEM